MQTVQIVLGVIVSIGAIAVLVIRSAVQDAKDDY